VACAGDEELRQGLRLVADGDGFAAHEVFELLWRAAPAAERDFLQGLVHVAVALHQDARANAVGRARQLEKACRRLAAYEPAHRGVDVSALRAWARACLAAGRCTPPPVG
jgi:predicted metal-dependent hydrolase